MSTLHYLHLDVFTEHLFGGNQLAVYLDPPPHLTTATMQSIAREMNFSETTFVFPGPGGAGAAASPEWIVRIFTPASELPMAGHPTIGTAFALAQAGRIAAGTPRVVFHEGVGPVPLDLEWSGTSLSFAWMTQPRPVFGPVIEDPSLVCASVALAVGEVSPGGLPVELVSCGVPYVLVPAVSRAAVDRAVPDARAHARALDAAGLSEGSVYLFALEAGPDGADVYARMFAPEIGIVEDPATGSAAGPLGAYLVRRGVVAPDRILRILQGAAMGRPSWIHVVPSGTVPRSVTGLAADIAGMRVGGRTVLAGEGTLYLQE